MYAPTSTTRPDPNRQDRGRSLRHGKRRKVAKNRMAALLLALALVFSFQAVSAPAASASTVTMRAASLRPLAVLYWDANYKGYSKLLSASPDQGNCDSSGYKRRFALFDQEHLNVSSIGRLAGPGIRCNHVVVNTMNYLGQVGSVCFSARLPVAYVGNKCNDSIGQITVFYDGQLWP